MERLFQKAEGLQIHGVVLIFLIVRDEEQRQLGVAAAQHPRHRDPVDPGHLNIQKRKIKNVVAVQNVRRVGDGRNGETNLMQPHVFLHMRLHHIQIQWLVVTN